MRRLAILSISLLVFVFLAGCIGQGGGGSGVTIKSFSALPSTAEPGTPVLLQLTIQNTGGATTGNVQAQLLGLTSEWITYATTSTTIGELYAADSSRGINQGAEAVAEWVATPPGKSVDISYDATAHVSYSYTSTLEAQIRAVSTVYLRQSSDTGGIKFQSVSSGPISIKVIAPTTVIAGTIPIQFSIQNTGGGRVENDVLTFRLNPGSGVYCTRYDVRLIQGRSATLYCTLNTGAVPNYQNFPISLSTTYNYWIEKTTTIKVLKTVSTVAGAPAVSVPVSTVPVVTGLGPTVSGTQATILGYTQVLSTPSYTSIVASGYQSCTQMPPRVTFQTNMLPGILGGTLTYYIQVSNYDTGCPPYTFPLRCMCNGDWTCSLAPYSVMLEAGGASGLIPVTVALSSTPLAPPQCWVIAYRNLDSEYGAYRGPISVNVLSGQGPIRSEGQPKGTDKVITYNPILSLKTKDAATCKYYNQPGVGYDSMILFSTTGGTSHSVTLPRLQDGPYTYYIKCKDSATGIPNTDDFPISFTATATASRAVVLKAVPTAIPADGSSTSSITASTSDNAGGVTITVTTDRGTFPGTPPTTVTKCTTGAGFSCSIPITLTSISSTTDVTATITGKADGYIDGTITVKFKAPTGTTTVAPTGNKPTISEIYTYTICVNGLTGIYVKGTGASKLDIDFGDGSAKDSTTCASTTTCETNFYHTYTLTGAYTIKATATDSVGQTDEKTKGINVLEESACYGGD